MDLLNMNAIRPKYRQVLFLNFPGNGPNLPPL